MSRLLLFSTLAVLTLALAGCGASEEKVSTITMNASAEGPFFAGANSLISNYQVDLNSLIEGQSLTTDAIHSIQLSGVKIQLEDSLTLSEMNSITLQLVGDNAPMNTVAVLNPVEGDGQQANLVVSEEADLKPYFTDGSFTAVLDLDLLEDSYAEKISAEMELELTIALK